MKLNDIFALLEKVAPVSLSDEFCKNYNMYDNSGIIIDCNQDISGAIFALDLTSACVEEAKKHGYNLIVTHHPAIYGGISRFDLKNNPQARALAECMKNGISVISMHLNFDAAPKGIDYYLMRGLGGEKEEATLCKLTYGGYGRVYSVKAQKFSDYVQTVSKELSTYKVVAYGDDKEIKKVASFCGAGCDENTISFAYKEGADVLVSADLKHHEIIALLGRGINVIQLTHYASENYGFNKIYLDIKEQLGIPSGYFNDKL